MNDGPRQWKESDRATFERQRVEFANAFTVLFDKAGKGYLGFHLDKLIAAPVYYPKHEGRNVLKRRYNRDLAEYHPRRGTSKSCKDKARDQCICDQAVIRLDSDDEIRCD